jgi:hypothetical protein
MFHVKPFLLSLALFPFFLHAQHLGSTSLEVKELPTAPARDLQIDEYLKPYSQSLSPLQREWFYWTNYSRRDPRRFWDSAVVPILKVHTGFRNSYTSSLKEDLYKTASLPFVKPNDNLFKTAQSLAAALAGKKGGPSHTAPDGQSFEDRMKSISVKNCAGENISFGSPNTLLMLVLLYIDEGVANMGHRKALLNPAFVEMGVGVGNYPENKVLVVQDFACDQK